jgi:replicative superfamily II helicase
MSKICGWNNSDFFYNLSKRLIYGVRVELLGLVEIKNIGQIRAEKLYSSGFKNKQDVMNNLEKASKAVGLTVDVLRASCLLDQKSQQDIQS